MAELLIRVVDKTSPDVYLDVGLGKRGDVVVACPDGWPWGREELSHPDWRIVRLPHLSLAEAQALTLPQPQPENPKLASRTALRRAVRLDLFDRVDLPQAWMDALADDRRRVPIVELLDTDFSVAALRAVAVTKPLVRDPLVIG